LSDAAARLNQGIALMNGGRFHEAIQAFGAALQQQALAWEPRVGISQSFLGLGDHRAGAAWLADACRVAPQREALWLELAGLLVRHERHAELEPLLLAAVAALPGSAALLRMQGEMYLRGANHAAALAAYRALYALHPQDPGVLLNLGFCMEQAGALEEAVALYREAAARKPDLMEAHVNLAGVLWRVDTSVAHLAGAMGKPVWVMLPPNADWRYLLDRDDSPWYPTMKLLRQREMGNWTEVISRVSANLRELAKL
jgi:tetratricopeptide (TPR) repeat protein